MQKAKLEELNASCSKLPVADAFLRAVNSGNGAVPPPPVIVVVAVVV